MLTCPKCGRACGKLIDHMCEACDADDRKARARDLIVSKLLEARCALNTARTCLGIVKPGGGSISDLGYIERDLKEMADICAEMQEARER